jgi:hypothetical protein
MTFLIPVTVSRAFMNKPGTLQPIGVYDFPRKSVLHFRPMGSLVFFSTRNRPSCLAVLAPGRGQEHKRPFITPTFKKKALRGSLVP